MRYTAEDITGLFPTYPKVESPNVIPLAISDVGICNRLFVALHEGDESWNPRGATNFKGPCRVIYEQWLDGEITLGYQGPL